MSRGSERRFHERLTSLGFGSYREYLDSEHWRDVKRRYAASKLPKACRVCRSPYQVLHHRTYKNLGAERLMDVIPLCHDHHGALHRAENRRGSTGLWAQTQRFIRRATA